MNRFFIDCEFDGHNGPLLSIAMVTDDATSIHISTDAEARDEWVIENVVPIMKSHKAGSHFYGVAPNYLGLLLRAFIGEIENPVIVADSPVDIWRFCRAISTGTTGGWDSADYPMMTFVVHNVDCYPTTLNGAVRHNAWWDAMALREKIHSMEAE